MLEGFELRVNTKTELTGKSEILSNGPLCFYVLSGTQTDDFVSLFVNVLFPSLQPFDCLAALSLLCLIFFFFRERTKEMSFQALGL